MVEVAMTVPALRPLWRDYLELCKPRVVALMLLTAIVGMLLATPGLVPLSLMFNATLGIALCAGAAAAVNHIIDRRIDALMGRTHRRPIPTGRLTASKAAAFAITLAVLGLLVLVSFVNTLTAVLTFTTLIGYACIYTIFLKHATSQNIVIGGLAGAAPPLLGWVAVTGQVDPDSLLLVLIIYTWTPPHFWALAIHRFDDYARAEVPMLPVTHGVAYTKLSILLYTLLLVVTTILPYLTRMAGPVYLIGALILGARFLYHAWVLMFFPRPRTAIKTFRFSILYLMALFIVLLIDHYLPLL